MYSEAKVHFIHKLENTAVRDDPFPFLYSENVFPEEFYAQIQKNLPEDEAYEPITKSGRVGMNEPGAVNRGIISLLPTTVGGFDPRIRDFWGGFLDILTCAEFLETFIGKFIPTLQERFGDKLDALQIGLDPLLIRDRANYSLGPHTDQPCRFATFIFYFPATDENPHLGTSFYVPKERGWSCEGGPHHKHEIFDRVFTADYRPNTVIGFPKSLISFHGVEPVEDTGVNRNLLHIAFGYR